MGTEVHVLHTYTSKRKNACENSSQNSIKSDMSSGLNLQAQKLSFLMLVLFLFREVPSDPSVIRTCVKE